MQLHKTVFGATHIVASRLSCEVGNVRGYFRGNTADRWLQLHDASQLPGDTAVPVWSMPLYQTAYFSWDWPRLFECQNGAVFAISETEATLTISTDVADFYVDGTAALVLDAPSIIGDLSNEIEYLDVVTAAARVFQIKVQQVASQGDVVWVHVFKNKEVSDLVTTETVPDFRHRFGSSSGNLSRTFSFGKGGLLVSKLCVAASETGPVYMATGLGDGLKIEAVYKAV